MKLLNVTQLGLIFCVRCELHADVVYASDCNPIVTYIAPVRIEGRMNLFSNWGG
jgi:hypothetical protein